MKYQKVFNSLLTGSVFAETNACYQQFVIWVNIEMFLVNNVHVKKACVNTSLVNNMLIIHKKARKEKWETRKVEINRKRNKVADRRVTYQ